MPEENKGGPIVKTDQKCLVAIRPFSSCPDVSKVGSDIVTTLDVSTSGGRRTLRKHLMHDHPDKETIINTRLDMVHVTAHFATKPDKKTGEISEFIRVIIQCADGKCYQFGSAGINKSLLFLSTLERMPPWDPPLSVILRLRTLDNGNIWPELELVEDDEPVAPQGRAGKGKG